MRKIFAVTTALLMLPAIAMAKQTVDLQTVEALRQMVIEASQTSSSKAAPPAKSAEEIARAKARLESHRAAFFKRAYSK
jgi:hypothetical protein